MAVHPRTLRKASVLGFTAGALVLAMTSSAFACTYFYGKLTVTATDPETNTSSSAFADGAGGDAIHSYCPTPAIVDNRTGGASEIVYPAQAMHRAPVFGVRVGRTTTCASPTLDNPDGQNSLATATQKTGVITDGTYDVRWFNLSLHDRTVADLPPANNALYNAAPNCNAGEVTSTSTGPVKKVGTISITGGAGAATNIPQQPTLAGDEVNICVKKPNTTNFDPSPPQVKLRMI